MASWGRTMGKGKSRNDLRVQSFFAACPPFLFHSLPLPLPSPSTLPLYPPPLPSRSLPPVSSLATLRIASFTCPCATIPLPLCVNSTLPWHNLSYCLSMPFQADA